VAFHHDPAAHELDRFSPLAAVHAANALVHAADDGGEADPPAIPRKLDRRYLKRLRCVQRLPTWRELATSPAAV
jgi:hypothetical protein